MSTSQDDLPPGYEVLNETELEQAARLGEQVNGKDVYDRQKMLEIEQVALARKQFCEQFGFDE